VSEQLDLFGEKGSKNENNKRLEPASPPADNNITKLPFLPGVSVPEFTDIHKLAELEQLAAGCSRCRLRAACTQVVFGEGDPKSPIMFVGEGPGKDEDISGRPFVGRAGQLLDKILQAGARVLKIEGRGRSPEYVKRVVECYNQAIDAIIANTYSEELINELTAKLSEVFNRGFWDGYYLGRKLGEWSERHSSSATKRKEFIGVATNYFSRIGVGEFILQTGEMNIGDEVIIIGPSTGVLELTVSEMHDDNGNIDSAKKGQIFAFPVPEKIRRNDKLYKLVES
jgi:hypothetical protein